jgi:hypothetical protein
MTNAARIKAIKRIVSLLSAGMAEATFGYISLFGIPPRGCLGTSSYTGIEDIIS